MPDFPQLRWTDADWLAEAQEWVDDRLDRLGLRRVGDIEQPHVRWWSTVLRVPTNSGNLWFKANVESLRHEAALVDLLARRRPDCAPPLLASDIERGWMLMSDAGEPLRTVVPRERSLDRWHLALASYAEMQLALMDAVDDMLAMGVPDLRLAVLPERYERLMDQIDAEPLFRDAAPLVAELCAQLAEYGIPETVQHDDLHDGQVFFNDGRPLLMDWGDACISHPFFTLSVTFEGVIAWGLDEVENSVDLAPFRDAYLAPFAARYDVDLGAACEVAVRLGWASRAINGHLPGGNEQTVTRLRMFLTGRPQ